MIRQRIERLEEVLAGSEMSGMVLNAGPSLAYFTGLDFHLMERPVVLIFMRGKTPVFILPRLEAAKVAGMERVRLFFYDEDPAKWPACFAEAMAASGAAGRTVGVEPLQLRLLEYRLLSGGAGETVFRDASGLVASLRAKKDEGEIALMQKAVAIAEQALGDTLPLLRGGMSEAEVASELTLQLFRHGADPTLPFSPIVSAGPNGANPHARPSGRRLAAGDLLVIDWGAGYHGYFSDLTRTFAVGEADEESAKIHRIVQQANEAGRQAGRIGASCGKVDRAARAVIEEAGYGRFFTHRTGHGIGRECHEEPYIREDNDLELEEGMTYTVEPGIYLPGRNGVRIEDDVVVRAGGAVSLSTLTRELVEIPVGEPG